jgi:hypothetical protein
MVKTGGNLMRKVFNQLMDGDNAQNQGVNLMRKYSIKLMDGGNEQNLCQVQYVLTWTVKSSCRKIVK